ncbi:MAG: cytochrome b N-terminal domain-containing protein [Proteobacteria bacterium]|nr:cytochrome b N-terminal domain-containing protein [Pseudomonadota bacterium]
MRFDRGLELSFPGRITSKISSFLPRLGLSALFLCLVSGVVLVFYYRPMGNVFQNVEEITTAVPYGWFFRQVHYAAGQSFVILMLLHTLDHFLRKRYRIYSLAEWVRLIFSLSLCFYTLFTGFVLKGDKEGFFAGRIFMNILEKIPLVGGTIAKLFIVPGDSFFFLPYLYHCFFLPILIVYLIRKHIREWFPSQGFMFIGTIGLFLYALFIKPSMDIPPEAPVDIVKGPWFFLGIQTFLKVLPPLLAGLIIPAVFVGCLIILPAMGNILGALSLKESIVHAGENGLYYLLIAAICAYGFLTLKGAIWGP